MLHLSYAKYETDVNITASLAKQQDDAMMEALHADDDEDERLRNQSSSSDEDDAFIPNRDQSNGRYQLSEQPHDEGL